ncbi:hypothetical protein ACMFMF_006141 [Clarireedia jacksonii]
MVLENSSASPPKEESFDSVPSSDNDPYAASENDQRQREVYNADYRHFRPMPILGSVFGYNEKAYAQVLGSRIAAAHNLLERRVTQEEIEALSFHTGKHFTILSYGSPLGIAGGLYRAYITAATFRFPFFQPNPEKFNANTFPTPRTLFVGSYARSVMTVGEMSDPRLKELTKKMREHVAQQYGRQLPSPAGIPRPPMKPGQYPQQSPNMAQDDTGPTGGMANYEEPAQEQTWGSPQTGRWKSRPQPQQPSSEQEQKPFDLFDDDASPTSGLGMQSDMSSSSQSSSSGGSAWEKIRRGQKPVQKQNTSGGWSRLQDNTQKEQREGSTMGDSFTFSKTEEERSLAQVEAQKEFDARVERERRGGDFSSGNGDQRRW